MQAIGVRTYTFDLPPWMERGGYEVYAHSTINKLWGKEFAYLAGDSGLSLRNFGFWVSDRT